MTLLPDRMGLRNQVLIILLLSPEKISHLLRIQTESCSFKNHPPSLCREEVVHGSWTLTFSVNPVFKNKSTTKISYIHKEWEINFKIKISQKGRKTPASFSSGDIHPAGTQHRGRLLFCQKAGPSVTWSTRGIIKASALSLLRKCWVSKRKILYKQFRINCSSKQHFSGSFSESKNASSVGESKNGNKTKLNLTI